MMTRIILLITIFCQGLLACKTDSSAAVSTSTQVPEYEVVSMVTLNVGNGLRTQATIENLRDSISAIPVQRPRSKLVIRDLSTGKITYQEECGDSTLSYPGFDVGLGTGLVMTTKGGSGDGIRVFEVTQTSARLVLAEGYRAAAITMPNDDLGGDMGFLIIDSESGTSPLVARRYQYDEGSKKYALTGTAPFSQFIHSVKAQFVKPVR
jgi:hypothetical protein